MIIMTSTEELLQNYNCALSNLLKEKHFKIHFFPLPGPAFFHILLSASNNIQRIKKPAVFATCKMTRIVTERNTDKHDKY